MVETYHATLAHTYHTKPGDFKTYSELNICDSFGVRSYNHSENHNDINGIEHWLNIILVYHQSVLS